MSLQLVIMQQNCEEKKDFTVQTNGVASATAAWELIG